MACAWRHSLPAKKSAATIARYVNLYRIICPSMTDNCFFELSLRWLAGCVYRGDECPLRVNRGRAGQRPGRPLSVVGPIAANILQCRECSEVPKADIPPFIRL